MSDVSVLPENLDRIEAARPPQILYALKDGDAFCVCDAAGDIGGAADGFFIDDTRILSFFQLLIGGAKPPLLSGAVSDDNVSFTSHATNRPLTPTGGAKIPEGVVHVERHRVLCHGRLYERLRLINFATGSAEFSVVFLSAADFRDMFEVRGHDRVQRGETRSRVIDQQLVEHVYCGLDDVLRRSLISFSEPGRLSIDAAEFRVSLGHLQRGEIYLEIGMERAPPPCAQRFDAAVQAACGPMLEKIRRGAHVSSSGLLFASWLDRSLADLALLVTDLPTGPYPYAGIPWFSTTFGRDALLTAWQMLWLDPTLARGVLRFLAATQAREYSAFRDAAPGKILHEARRGEMAVLGEVPFERYYGGVDTTCLFVALAASYADRTGEISLIDALWEPLCAAVRWLDSFAGATPDGLITYERGAESGLVNQGWKDSHDSVFHADGTLAEGPIALVEVQGYAFAAYSGMVRLSRRRGDEVSATRWRSRAQQLRRAVETRFWMEEKQFYGLAIDGAGRLCRVMASNAGHLLLMGLPSLARGRAVARQLMKPDFYTGWGLRTLASGQPRYNPMSYHNGSIWPHDTALCAIGMRRYGEADCATRLLQGLFEAAGHFEMRLPELFCGFPRRGAEAPVGYPVACIPQAWAAAAAFGMLQACLGVGINGWTGEIRVVTPRLPAGIRDIEIKSLAVGGREVALAFRDVGGLVSVLRTGGDQSAVPLIIEA